MESDLLKAILMTVGRQAFSIEELVKLVAPTSGGEKQLQAYNLCDGQHTQAQITKAIGLDKGSLSRTIARWVEAGIVHRVGSDELPLHVYPLPKSAWRLNKLEQAK